MVQLLSARLKALRGLDIRCRNCELRWQNQHAAVRSACMLWCAIWASANQSSIACAAIGPFRRRCTSKTAADPVANCSVFRHSMHMLQRHKMEFHDVWDIEGTSQYLRQRGFTRPALQFPDDYLADCKAVAEAVQSRCDRLGHRFEVS